MNSTRKKQLLLLLILIMAALILFAADSFFDEQKEVPPPIQNNLTEQTIAIETLENPVVQNVISLKFPEDFASPFASLNDIASDTNGGANSPAPPPLIPQIPDNMPAFSANFELPDMLPDSITAPARDVFLKAVLYRPGRSNMAILDDGANEFIIVEGTSSPYGYVSKITASTVTLDGRTLTLEL